MKLPARLLGLLALLGALATTLSACSAGAHAGFG
jgi:hypothetical protein